MTRVVFAAHAERQLDALYRFIAAEGGAVRAESYVGLIVEHCEGLRRFPERGNRRDDIRRGLRTIGFRRRVTIAFTVAPETIVILASIPAVKITPSPFATKLPDPPG